ncbi:MAG: heme o synthase [Acidobacteriota bacterium]
MNVKMAAMPQTSATTDLYELTKPRLTLMVVLTAVLGVWLGGVTHGFPTPVTAVAAVLGTLLLASGAAALNMWWEADLDARMRRTARRPIPAGRISPTVALLFGFTLLVTGGIILAAFVNQATLVLGLVTVLFYVVIYTPLKTVTSLATLIGAIPGALPPAMGWTAVTGEFSPGAWALFAILFFWQLPHFYAIAYMHRDDYRDGGFVMLSNREDGGLRLAVHSLVHTLLLGAASVSLFAIGITGGLYLAVALLLAAAFLYFSVLFLRERSWERARRVMLFSLLYLPALILGVVIDRLI